MTFKVDDLQDQMLFRQMRTIPYNGLVIFVLEQLKKRSTLMVIYWILCLFFLLIALAIRIYIAGTIPFGKILIHSFFGIALLPVFIIPIHEILHILPYYFSGARSIRFGMDLKQYLFYVTAHRYVAAPGQFKFVAAFPFLVISIFALVLIFLLPGLWKWSISLFLFVHATMCAGDFALLNFYFLHRDKEIYTWDDADKKEAYFFEKLPDSL